MTVQRGDTVPVPGARVVLHRVGRAAEGPVDSTSSDPAGRFRFRFTADTTSIYLISSRYAGIEYFSPPVHLNPARPDTALRVVVSDTSSTQRVALEARHLVVARPRSDGSRAVLDLIVLNNRGDRTRIAGDSLTPTWSAALPRGSLGLEAGEGDYSPDAVRRTGDRLLFYAPIPPGEKQIVVDYVLPAGLRKLVLPMRQPAELVNVLLEERKAQVTTPSLAVADSELIQSRTYYRWTGSLTAGDTLRVGLPGSGAVPSWLLPALVAAVGLAFVVAAVRLLPRPGAAGARQPDVLLASLARLDAAYGGREAEVAPVEWARYTAERARLKAALEAALATIPQGS
ncbi:MAG TPA: hypothetical protein VFW66_12710 [Gemmatimonadales bacterium]|nr:hypothetical protein [Gemmatimonadales bacterium]